MLAYRIFVTRTQSAAKDFKGPSHTWRVPAPRVPLRPLQIPASVSTKDPLDNPLALWLLTEQLFVFHHHHRPSLSTFLGFIISIVFQPL